MEQPKDFYLSERLFEEAETHLKTVRDFLRFSVSSFEATRVYFGHGHHSPFDEAVYLTLKTLHLPLDQLDPYIDARLTPSERRRLLGVLRQRIERRIPSAYLMREAWLIDHRFYVDERVIVPRSFIAELLQHQLAPWVSTPQAILFALDLCTGSGCLAILMAEAFEQAQIDAIDCSADALAVAALNVEAYGLQHRVRLIQSDLWKNRDTLGPDKRYDLIISNPPYVDAASFRTLPAEYRHEPAVALEGGADGLDVVRNILQQAAAHLSDEGLLIVEIGRHRAALEAAFPTVAFTWLDTSAGEDFVFLLSKEALLRLSGEPLTRH